ncbi:hypothetical protein EYF80_030674 [Liparis tanakae]|uniref:Uncharacterized protein n=1 Tax=Liparis tanakae TaxID=230148 RepID=A0A4Z2H107_9TELE|nr:hypothetical protein EYF80_030674 [Liparis tanakae]
MPDEQRAVHGMDTEQHVRSFIPLFEQHVHLVLHGCQRELCSLRLPRSCCRNTSIAKVKCSSLLLSQWTVKRPPGSSSSTELREEMEGSRGMSERKMTRFQAELNRQRPRFLNWLHDVMCAGRTCGGVDAGRDVEVAERVGVRPVAAAPLVAVVPALMVRQAAGQGGLRGVPVTRAPQVSLEVQL